MLEVKKFRPLFDDHLENTRGKLRTNPPPPKKLKIVENSRDQCANRHATAQTRMRERKNVIFFLLFLSLFIFTGEVLAAWKRRCLPYSTYDHRCCRILQVMMAAPVKKREIRQKLRDNDEDNVSSSSENEELEIASEQVRVS